MTSKGLALITGASSGIGAAYARHAAAQGFDVALTARRADRLEALAGDIAERHGVQTIVAPLDLSLPDAPEKLHQTITSAGQAPSVLINNAGYSIPAGFASTSLEDQQRFIQLTVAAPVALAHLCLPAMLEKGWGRIINVSSITAFSCGGKGHTLYPAGKSFLIKFSQSLNAELSEKGVQVTAVAPAMVETEFQQANGTADKLKGAPRRFAQSPEEIVEESWRRNEKGAEIVVPGFLPKIVAAMMRYIPEPLTRTLMRRAAEKYYVGD